MNIGSFFLRCALVALPLLAHGQENEIVFSPPYVELPGYVVSYCSRVNAEGKHCNAWMNGPRWVVAWGDKCWTEALCIAPASTVLQASGDGTPWLYECRRK